MAGKKTSSVTITAKIGPGVAASSVVLSNVIDVDFQIANDTIQITQLGGKISTFDYEDTATVTYTITTTNAVIAISS